jgi:hypothetical protein
MCATRVEIYVKVIPRNWSLSQNQDVCGMFARLQTETQMGQSHAD